MISVIIPAYNNLDLFKRALHSVLKQKNVSFELIVVDDSSYSDIDNYVHSLNDGRIHYFHNIPAKGAVRNWNFGLSLASGEKLLVLHHDEELKNDDYMRRIDSLLDIYDLTICNKQVLTSGRKSRHIPQIINKIIIKRMAPLFFVNCIGPCACIAIKRSVLCSFDERLHWKVDTDWYYRTLKAAKRIHYINSIEILSHHGHQGQITLNLDIPKIASEDAEIIRKKYNSTTINFYLFLGTLYYRFRSRVVANMQ